MERSKEQVWQDYLVLKAQDGDTASMELLVRVWHRRLLGLALRLTGEMEQAKEACQESWLAIARGIDRLDNPARFAAWAMRIVANKCADLIRRNQRRRTSVTDLDETSVIAGQSAQDADKPGDDVSTIRNAMQRMPAEQRLILGLYYQDELSVAAIATILGIPPGTVKSRLFHARNVLKKLVNGESNDEH